MARRTLSLTPMVLLFATAVVALKLSGAAFLPGTTTTQSLPLRSGVAAGTAASSLAVMGGLPHAALANEGSVIPLGGGFAINLDIPETGVVNIAILIAGLIYLLGPVLSESMSTREKEIQQDIDDAIAKYEEATSRLAEAEKNQAQADQVIAEIEASIQKDKDDFKKRIEASTASTIKDIEESATKEVAGMAANVDLQVESYIQLESIKLGARKASELTDAQKSKILDKAIS
eukprot:CAMPEP_0178447166 /NCGR_PEP_ID=MMETSP0689_2-20121128/41230_1 /TAXON_ID=160604 /ORGANISM="Amphidinium massartii, Strain CS-259" /LENGTH=231 /DNA_ID=CAMNT_0020072115 /DNA_START=84 /DNA_END=776 /DNA_ORIENTATION=-